MLVDRVSYRKTLLVAVAIAVVSAVVCELGRRWLQGLVAVPVLGVFVVAGWMTAAAALCVAGAAVLVIYRDLRNDRGQLDLFESLNAGRSDARYLAQGATGAGRIPLRRLRRCLGAPRFVTGERVRVRSLPEIVATLDGSGCIDGLPFMAEMARFCGQQATVFRCVDKVYDYGGRKDLRRIRDVVLLAGLRCDGSMHDGCQAGCYVLWHTRWLQQADDVVETVPAPIHTAGNGAGVGQPVEWLRGLARRRPDPGGGERYVCQYTEIVAASRPMKSLDLRQDIRPLIAGNVTLAAFVVAVLTRLFNRAQRLRGGVGYPAGRSSNRESSPRIVRGLKAGNWVEVERPEAIGATLDRSGRNRGLWFDRDMLKHCGRRYQVKGLVDRIIDDSNGQMRTMKLPCLILDGVSTSGEFLRFCAQHDFPFWRDAWLARVEVPAAADVSRRDAGQASG